MRLFVAVNPPRQLCRDLDTRLDDLRAQVPVAWTTAENWHLTLMFLADWPVARLPGLVEALRHAAARHAPFAVRPGQVGGFPDLQRPRVLFLQMEGGDPLRLLARDIRAAVDSIWPDGPQDHKPMLPHLTLARIKRPLTAQEQTRLRRFEPRAGEPFTVTEAQLVSSELQPQGPRHRREAALPLGG